jgi:2-(1,2-epoxy-1,2-dihydrophenyl)acetyl-CoA isomerase
MTDLVVERADGVLRITLNRPDAGNAIHFQQRNEMIGVLEEAGADLTVRAVVVGATGKHFCTGADLRAAQPDDRARPDGAPDRAVGEIARGIQRGAQRLIAAVLDCPKPVLASVNGTAAGLGANLALACDLVVAAESAKFIQVFVRRGITPDAGTAFLLPRLVGLAKAKELVFFGDDLPAAEAARIGLVNACVPDADLAKVVDEWATRLAGGPTTAIGLSKWLLNRSLQSDRHGAFEDEAWAQDLASRTADFGEGVAAFVERRDVEFRGW